jgi:hypothetical protein
MVGADFDLTSFIVGTVLGGIALTILSNRIDRLIDQVFGNLAKQRRIRRANDKAESDARITAMKGNIALMIFYTNVVIEERQQATNFLIVVIMFTILAFQAQLFERPMTYALASLAFGICLLLSIYRQRRANTFTNEIRAATLET